MAVSSAPISPTLGLLPNTDPIPTSGLGPEMEKAGAHGQDSKASEGPEPRHQRGGVSAPQAVSLRRLDDPRVTPRLPRFS